MVIAGPDQLPEFLHDEWEERSAIMEYDGGLPRERAEALAPVSPGIVQIVQGREAADAMDAMDASQPPIQWSAKP